MDLKNKLNEDNASNDNIILAQATPSTDTSAPTPPAGEAAPTPPAPPPPPDPPALDVYCPPVPPANPNS